MPRVLVPRGNLMLLQSDKAEEDLAGIRRAPRKEPPLCKRAKAKATRDAGSSIYKARSETGRRIQGKLDGGRVCVLSLAEGPVRTLQDLEEEARYLLAWYRDSVRLCYEACRAAKKCWDQGCSHVKQVAFLPGAPVGPAKCPFCVDILAAEARVADHDERNLLLVEAAPRLLPDGYFGLEAVHLATDLSGDPWFLTNNLDAAERDWNRLLKAAVVARAREVETAADQKPQLTEKQAAVLEVLRGLPPERGLIGERILDALAKRVPPVDMDLSTLTRHILPVLKEHYGVRNKPRVGYFVSPQG